MMRKLAKSALVAIALGAATAASAGDIISIDALHGPVYAALNGGKSYPNPDNPLSIGETLSIRVRLINADRGESQDAHPWVLTGTSSMMPELGLSIGGVVRWAQLVSCEPAATTTKNSQHYFTDLIFQYTVRPGDLAQPVGLLNESLVEAEDGTSYAINMPSGLSLLGEDENLTEGYREVVWSYCSNGEVNDMKAYYPPKAGVDESGVPTSDKLLHGKSVYVKTIDFDSNYVDSGDETDPWIWRTIHKDSTKTTRWGNPSVVVDANADYSSTETGYATMYVWSENEMIIVPVGETQTREIDGVDRKVLPVKITTGDKSVPFTLRAVGAVGEGCWVFMSSAPQREYSATNGELKKNTVSRYVKVGEKLRPNISLTFGDNQWADAVASSDYSNPVEMYVTLSDVFESDVTVTVKPVLLDGDGNEIDVYAKHVIGTDATGDSGNGWLKSVTTLTFSGGVETEKSLFIFPLGATALSPRDKGGIEFRVESVTPAAASDYFVDRPVATLGVTAQKPEGTAAEDPYSFIANKARDVEIEVADGFRNIQHTADAADVAAAGDQLWKVVWNCNDDDDPDACTKYTWEGLVPQESVADPEKMVLALTGVKYPDVGEYESVVTVINPDGKQTQVAVSAEVSLPRTVVGTPDREDFTYTEGEKAQITVEITKKDNIDVYAYFDPINDDAKDGLSCANLAKVGNSGIEIPRGKTVAVTPMTVSVLDGTKTPSFRVVLSDKAVWEADAVDETSVREGYEFSKITLIVNNREPEGKSMEVGGGAVANGGVLGYSLPIDNRVTIKASVNDVKADLKLSSTVSDEAFKKWLEGGHDAEADVAAINEAGIFLTKFVFKNPAGRLLEADTIVVPGVNKSGVVSVQHEFNALGTNIVEVQMLDKDMFQALIDEGYTRSEIVDWVEEDGEGRWVVGIQDDQWGPKYVVGVPISDKPHVQIVPRNIYTSPNGQNGWNEDRAGADYGFNITLSDPAPRRLQVKVTLERTANTAVTDIKKLGSFSMKNTYGEVVLTEDNEDPDARCMYVTINASRDKPDTSMFLELCNIDGTQFSSYRLKAEVVTTTLTDDLIPLNEYFEPDYCTFSVFNLDPELTFVGANIGMQYSVRDGASTNVVSVSRNEDINIDWTVKDFVTFDQGDGSDLTVTWNSSEPGSRKVFTDQTEGTVTMSFSSSGDKRIICTVTDKDGGSNSYEWFFYVEASKRMYVYPLGPRRSSLTDALSRYATADGLGVGIVEGSGSIGGIENFRQGWDYPVNDSSAFAWARGLRAGESDQSLRAGRARTWWVGQDGSGVNSADQAYVNPDETFDSFFYAAFSQMPDESGRFETALLKFEPHMAQDSRSDELADATIALPKAEKDAVAYDDRHVEMIFSKEWRELDNCGDINQDGVPDFIIKNYGLGVYDKASVSLADDLLSAAGYNDDEDYLPQNASSGITIVPNTQDKWQDNGGAFNAKLEVRGWGEGLNRGYLDAQGNPPAPDYTTNEKRAWLLWRGLATKDELAAKSADAVDALFNDNIADATDDLALANRTNGAEGWSPERPTDPTVADTDEDGLPDGDEYWFWYGARVGYDKDGTWQGPMTGRFLNLDDLEEPTIIQSDAICEAFDPLAVNNYTTARDFDGDGLTDAEELAIGTNPVDCDTDGDGCSDGYEVMWGMNPIDAADGTGNPSNPDGDCMAYTPASSSRIVTFEMEGPVPGTSFNYMYLVSYIDDDTQTFEGSLLRTSANEIDVADVTRTFRGEQIPVSLGNFTVKSYKNALNFTVSETGLALYHDQVYKVFGFDPRTAWTGGCIHGNIPRWCHSCHPKDDKRQGSLNVDTGKVINTRGLTQLDEYLWGKYHGIVRLATDKTVLDILRNSCTNPNATFDKTYGDWSANVADTQHGADTDGDACPDGWTMYVGGDPITPQPGATHFGALNNDGDLLQNSGEFAGLDSSEKYSACESLAKGKPEQWLNKFWPTDPSDEDTDADGLSDSAESGVWDDAYPDTSSDTTPWSFSFCYTTATDDGVTLCYRGGGLNPCTADTDFDNLPDAWEMFYAGIVVDGPGYQSQYEACDGVGLSSYSPTGPYVTGGMDATDSNDAYTTSEGIDDVTGTVRDYDWDGDGLENYQEYLIQSVRCWRYDDTLTPLMGRGIIWGEAGVEDTPPRLSEPVEGGMIPMNILSGVNFFQTVKTSPLWAAYCEGNPAFEDMTSFDYVKLGYMAPCSKRWDMMRMKAAYADTDELVVEIGEGEEGETVIGEVYNASSFGVKVAPGICWMRKPHALVDVLTGAAGSTTLRWKEGFKYVSCDPRKWDTDADGLDDFWEVYHGLNPLYGKIDVVGNTFNVIRATDNIWTQAAGGFALDPATQPWTIGHPDADPDGDGLRNRDEGITGNLTDPTTYHTDPTPLWMTDSTTPASYTVQYYRSDVDGVIGMYDEANEIEEVTSFNRYGWQYTIDEVAGSMPGTRSTADSQADSEIAPHDYIFSFERNEGYDTDGDWRGDGHEVARLAMSTSDPLDMTDPDRRAALYLPGQDACAYSFNESRQSLAAYDTFRQFTVECWVKPEATGREQTILERGFSYPMSNLANSETVWRVNFRLALDASGHVIGMFDNDNAVPSGTEGNGSVFVDGGELALNDWTHVALTFDGSTLSIYVDGLRRDVATTALIPANGVYVFLQEPTKGFYPAYQYASYEGANVVGAHRTVTSFAWHGEDATFEQFDQFFKGWVAEVRFWDGARTAAEIRSAYRKRMSEEDIEENRQEVYAAWKEGKTRNNNDGNENLPAMLKVLYNFAQLPAAAKASDVSQLPSGFESVIENSGLPAEDTEIGWWKDSPLRSTVYTDAHVVPQAKNVFNTLPIMSGTFMDSMYWSQLFAGYVSASSNGVSNHNIPDGGFPYGDSFYLNELEVGYWRLLRKGFYLYGVDLSDDEAEAELESTDTSVEYPHRKYRFDLINRFLGMDSLVPLGGAYARVDKTYWDDMGPSSAWTETREDADGDDLPDWWEAVAASKYGAPDAETLTARTTVNYNGVEMFAYEAYLRDLAAGMQPGGSVNSGYASTADADGDGLVDWWQDIYDVKGGAAGDDDADGLANFVEYVLTEYFKVGTFSPINPFSVSKYASDYFYRVGESYVGEIFTDFDRTSDQWEDKYDGVSRYIYDANADADNDGWSNQSEFQAGTNPTKTGSLSIDEEWINEYPVPVVETHITYEGTQSIAGKPFVVQAWHDMPLGVAESDPIPDAVWTIGGSSDSTSTSTSSSSSSSSVDEGNGSKYVGINPGKQMRIHLSPGSVVAGSVNVQVKDLNWVLWDMNSDMTYATDPDVAIWIPVLTDRQRIAETGKGDIIRKNNEQILGEIDYETGVATIDFSKLDGWYGIVGQLSSQGVTQTSGMYSMYQLAQSYVKVTWTSMPVVTGASATYYLGEPDARTAENNSFGHLKEGLNKFVAFCDLDEDGKYTAGEPYGVAPDVNVSWSSTAFSIELTDTTPIVTRFAVAAGTANDREVLWGTENGDVAKEMITAGALSGGRYERVRIVRTFINGRPCVELGVQDRTVLDKVLDLQNDAYVTEADFLGDGSLDLDWEYLASDIRNGNINASNLSISNVTYRVVLGNGTVAFDEENNLLSLAFNKRFDSRTVYHNEATPVHLGPSIVTTPSPTFVWTIPNSLNSYTAFEVVVQDESGKEIWSSGQRRMPARIRDTDTTWRYEWTAPIFADSYLPDGSKVFENNKTYKWNVSVFNSLYKDDDNFASVSTPFRMNVVTNSVDAGVINVAARYFGQSAVKNSGKIRVQAFKSPDFNGVPVGEACVASTAALANGDSEPVANARIVGLPAGTYYVRAFIDTQADGECAAWESQGFACDRDVPGGVIYTPEAVVIGPKFGEGDLVKVFIEDVDTDCDNLPDAWEWTQKGNLTSLSVTALDQTLTGFVAVKKSLSQTFTGTGTLTSGLSARLMGALASPYSAAMVLGVDVSEAESADDAATAIGAAVAEELEPKTVRFTSIALDVAGRKVTLGIETETTDVADAAVASLYEFDTTGALTVTMRLWRKETLDGEWSEIAAAARDVTIGADDGDIELPLGDADLGTGGFFKVTLERK